MTEQERLAKIKKSARDYYDNVVLNQKDYVYLIEQEEKHLELKEEREEWELAMRTRDDRVEELEKEFELCDSTIHMIDMTINNPSTSDDDKWEKVKKIIKKYYADDCIHCNDKGFNGLDYCPNCVRGDVLKENLELEQQNKRYREVIKSMRSEIKYALYSNKSEDVKKHYLQNAERKADEALEEST